VTNDPPTLLVCMNRGSARHATFEKNGVLCVNVLAARQKALSPLFAGPPETGPDARFAAASWCELQTGSPVLDDAVTSFDCRIAQTTSVGTHSVFFCEVMAIQSGPAHEGLIYFGRDYHGLAKLP
jgi:flavin reductase